MRPTAPSRGWLAPLVTVSLLAPARPAPGAPCGAPELVADVAREWHGLDPDGFLALPPITFFTGNGCPWVTDGTDAGTREIVPLNASFKVQAGGLALFHAPGLGLYATDGTASGTVLLRFDNGGSATDAVTLAGIGYLGLGDQMLWRTSGTPGGTYPIGPPDLSPSYLLVVGNEIYFSGRDVLGGRELWKTDGTDLGTVRIGDICPGTCDGVGGPMALLGTRIFFRGSDGTGPNLWTYDLTTSAFALFRTVSPRTEPNGQWLVAAGSLLYFVDWDPANGMELWKTDGTVAGTALVKDIRPGNQDSGVGNVTAVGARIYFRADDGTNGSEAWVSDGTVAGTLLLADAYPGRSTPSTGGPGAFVDVGPAVLFQAYDGSALDIWETDGTPAGTRARPHPDRLSVLPYTLGKGADGAYFAAVDRTCTGSLWRDDGTPTGQVRVSAAPSEGLDSLPSGFVELGGRMLFTAIEDPIVDPVRQLWTTDGTPAGTLPLTSVPSQRDVGSPARVGREMLFRGPGPSSSRFDAELWHSDGTAAGTALLLEINRSATSGSGPDHLTSIGSRVYFSASDGSARVLWASDGTAAGTAIFADIPNPERVVEFGSRQLVTVRTPARLYVTDGTPAGTVLLATSQAAIDEIAVVGPRAYVRTVEGVLVTDGTAAGTLPPPGLPAGQYWSLAGSANGFVYLAQRAGADSPLWAYDTVRERAELIHPFEGVDVVGAGATAGTTLFFGAKDTAATPSLWKTDGTTAGTQLVLDGFNVIPDGLVAIGPEVLFVGWRGASGRELWRSDGTPAGTVAIEVDPGPNYAFLVAADFQPAVTTDRVWFGARRTDVGTEPWSMCFTRVPWALLRNTDARPPSPDADALLPLRLSRDRYLDAFTSGFEDPAPIVTDASRPLVFYALDGDGTLRLTKTTALGVRLQL